jgi:predicted DNA-binding protein (UPF0251 family)
MNDKHVTKQEFAKILGMSYRTFQRRIKEANIRVPRGLLSPVAQDFIRRKLEEYELKKLNGGLEN